MEVTTHVMSTVDVDSRVNKQTRCKQTDVDGDDDDKDRLRRSRPARYEEGPYLKAR